MPRITYADRFAVLLAKNYLSERDRKFAESMFAHYQRKKALTPGRRRCFLQLEERYASPPKTDDAMIERIEDLRTRLIGNDAKWANGFTESLLAQARSGASLSVRQEEVLTGIESKWTNEQLAIRESWSKNFTPEMREKFDVMVKYYAKNGYFQNIVASHKSSPEKTPSKGDYDRVTQNKYAVKVLAGWFDEPSFSAGSMVSLRSSAAWALRRAITTGLAVIIETNAMVPASACRGNKIYKVLPVGGVQTMLVEERHLKAARIPKKKKK
tara:strand:+ start:1452 stop:2258 length:807 start_codon:yes stop_codon:yes gene_type:complete